MLVRLPVAFVQYSSVMLIVIDVQHLQHTLTHGSGQSLVRQLAVRKDEGKDAIIRERR